MKRIITLIAAFLVFGPMAFSYHGEIVITNSTGESFFLLLNGQKQNHSPRSKVIVNDLRHGRYDIRVKFYDRRLGEIYANDVKVYPDSKNIFRIIRVRRRFDIEFVRHIPKQIPREPYAHQPKKSNGYGHSKHHGSHPKGHNNGYDPRGDFGGCYQPMDKAVFLDMRRAIERRKYEKERLSTAKRLLRNQCISSRQVKRLITLFHYERSKVELAKFSYEFTIDKENYHIINEVFGHSSSSRELDWYISQYNGYKPHAGIHPQGSCTAPGNDDENWNNGYPLPQGNATCTHPMSEREFKEAHRMVYEYSFDEDKLRIAKQVISGQCVSSQQVRVLMETLSSENSRLDLAKFAYEFTIDPHNYYQVNSAFDFSSSARKLDEYLAGGYSYQPRRRR